MVHRWYLDRNGTLLEAKPKRPAEHRRCTAVFGGSFETLDAAFSSDDDRPTKEFRPLNWHWRFSRPFRLDVYWCTTIFPLLPPTLLTCVPSQCLPCRCRSAPQIKICGQQYPVRWTSKLKHGELNSCADLAP